MGCFFGEAIAGVVSVEGRFGRGGAPEFQPVVGQANELPFGVPLGDASQGELAETADVLDLTAVFIHRETTPARLVPFVAGRPAGWPSLLQAGCAAQETSERTWMTNECSISIDRQLNVSWACGPRLEASRATLRGERSRDATARDGRQFCVVFQLLRGKVRNPLVRHHAPRVVVAVVARVGHEILRPWSDLGRFQVGFPLVEQRSDLSNIVGWRRDRGGDDERRFIDQSLSIAAPARPEGGRGIIWVRPRESVDAVPFHPSATVPARVRRLPDLRVGVGEVALSLRFRPHVIQVDRRWLFPFGFTNGVLRRVLSRRGVARLVSSRGPQAQETGS